MKKLGIEESLKRVAAYGDGGRAECLHAARPQVRDAAQVIERLRNMASGERV